MPDQPPGALPTTIACPFCGLGCDDLSPLRDNTRTSVDSRGCPVAERRFRAALAPPSIRPRIAGRAVPLSEALDEIARHLAQARLPLFAGLSGDLADQRGALRLAARTGGAIDHRNGDGLICNLSVLESGGWLTTSLGEVRNRADLLVLVGGGLGERFPRLLERLTQPPERLHTETPPAVVRIDSDDDPEGPASGHVRVPPGRLRDLIGVLRARIAGQRLDTDAFAQAADLAERLKAASYPVIAFNASLLGSEPHPDLVVRALAALVKDLNAEGRSALLPLGGGDGETTAQQVSAWHTGFGVRQGFHTGVPRYNPRGGGTDRLLSHGGVDLLVWVSTLSADPPPLTTVPTLVLGHPAIRPPREPEVFVPLAVPGVHRTGAVHRGDGVAMLPLTAFAESTLPESGPVFDRLLELLAEERHPC